jgi:ubiquinone/menaquinone biosynthesis C-methylase UbiE
MALSTDGTFSKDDYVKQPAFVEQIIKEDGKKNILEFGSGNGYNSIYLAKRNPHVTFTSIDLTPIHIRESKKHSRLVDNVHFYEDDFEDTHLESNSYDLLFSIESVCHAYHLEKALSEAYRLLKENGKLIIYDGFQKIDPNTLEKELQTMTLLVERSMSVGSGNTTEHFVETLKKVGFQDIAVEDFSNNFMPNLLQLQNYALHYFNKIPRAKLLRNILPFDLLKNAIAGLFMPITVELGIHGYYRIIARK